MSIIRVLTTNQKGRCAVAACDIFPGTTILQEDPCVGVNSSPQIGIFQMHNNLKSLLCQTNGNIDDICLSCILTIRLIQKSRSNSTLEKHLEILMSQISSHSLTLRKDTIRIATVVHSHFSHSVSFDRCLQYSDIIIRNVFAITDPELR